MEGRCLKSEYSEGRKEKLSTLFRCGLRTPRTSIDYILLNKAVTGPAHILREGMS
jgi:hypothetical protein